MPTQLDALIEAERRGILPPKMQGMLSEARRRGLLQPEMSEEKRIAAEADARIQREMEMSPEEYDVYVRERMKEGEPYRPQPGSGLTGSLFTNQMVDPFGVRDEIVGAGQFARKFVTSGGDIGEASEAYSNAADLIRAEQRAASGKYGPAPEIIGGFGTSGLAKGFKMAPSFLGRVSQSAKAGAGYGAATAAGRSEGGIGERITGAGQGAAFGAVLGPVVSEAVAPAIGGIVRAGGASARGLGKAARYLGGSKANIDQRFLRALEQQDMTLSQAGQALQEARQAAKFGKTQLEPQFTLADLGPVTRDLADTAALVSSEARGQAKGFLYQRARESFGRVNDYFRRSLKVARGDFAKTQAKLIDEQQRLSKTAYDDFRNMDVTIPVGNVLYSRQIDDLAAAPALKKTLQQAREQFVAATAKRDLTLAGRRTHTRQMGALKNDLNTARDNLRDLRRKRQDTAVKSEQRDLRSQIREQEDAITAMSRDLQTLRSGKPAKTYATQAYTELTPARFDAGKRALDDMIESAVKAGRNNEARLLTRLKSELVAVADQATTVPGTNRSLYAEARDVYGSRAQLLDALDAGRSFMRGDAEITGAQYKALTTGEKRMFRTGMAREMRKTLGQKQLGHNMTGIFDRPNTREVLEEIMTPKQAKTFYRLVEVEDALNATNQAVRGNSKTAERQQNIADFSLGVRLGRALKDKNLREVLWDEITDQITKYFSMREGDAVGLTKVLFETDPVKQQDYLAQLARTYGSPRAKAIVNRALRITRQRLATARRSLSGIIGELTGQASAQRPQLSQR